MTNKVGPDSIIPHILIGFTTPAYIKQYQCCSYHICYCTRVSAGQCTVCKKTQPFPSIFTKNNQCHDTPLSKENYHPFTLFTMDKLLSWCRIIINTDFQYIPDIISISDSKRRIKNCQMWSNSKCQLTPVTPVSCLAWAHNQRLLGLDSLVVPAGHCSCPYWRYLFTSCVSLSGEGGSVNASNWCQGNRPKCFREQTLVSYIANMCVERLVMFILENFTPDRFFTRC